MHKMNIYPTKIQVLQKNNHNSREKFNMNIWYLASCTITITIITACALFWILRVFKHSRNMYSKFIEATTMYEHDTDSEGYNSIEFFKTQFVKDVIIIVSAILEWYSGVGLLFYDILPKSDVILERIDDYEIKLNICSEANFSRYKELANFDSFGVSYKLIESSNASIIISSALGIGLMRLLIAEFKFPNPLQRTKRDLRNTVLLSIVLCCMLLLFTMSSYTWPLAVILGGVIAPLYLYMFLKELNKLQAALAQYSRERLVQFGNNRIEQLKLRRFKVLSNFLRIALILFVTTMLYQKINLTISFILYFGQCFFPLTYGIQYTPILHTVTQQLMLFEAVFYISRVKLFLQILTGLMVGVPLVVFTVMSVIHLIYYQYKIRNLPTRFKVNLTNRLIQPK